MSMRMKMKKKSISMELSSNTQDPRKSHQRRLFVQLKHHDDTNNNNNTTTNDDTTSIHETNECFIGTNYGSQASTLMETAYAIGVVFEEAEDAEAAEAAEAAAAETQTQTQTQTHSDCAKPLKITEIIPIEHVYTLKRTETPAAVATTTTATVPHENDKHPINHYDERRRELIEAYGSKKRKRDLASHMANKIVMQGEAYEAIEQTLVHVQKQVQVQMQEQVQEQNQNQNQNQDENQDENQKHMNTVPPHNGETKNVEKIYESEHMIDRETWNHLPFKQMYRATKKPSLLKEQPYSEFVTYRLTVVHAQAKSDEEGATKKQIVKVKCHQLAYIDTLLHFIRAPSKAKSSTVQKMNVDDVVKGHLITTFCEVVHTDKGARTTHSKAMAVKSMCWLAVMALTVCAYTLDAHDIDLLAHDLSIAPSTLVPYFRQVGCTIAKRDMCRLTAPLTLPRPRKRIARKR